MNAFVARRYPQLLAGALCGGLACANVARVGGAAVLLLGVAIVAVPRVGLVAVLALAGWWWGSLRLDQLDRSALAASVGEAGRARVVVTATPRRGRFEIRAPAVVTEFARRPVHEPVMLELRSGQIGRAHV